MSDRARELADQYYAKQERRLAGEEPIDGEILPRELNETIVERLILEMDGNIGAIASILDVRSSELRAFVEKTPKLRDAMSETFELAIDQAVKTLWEGVRDEGSFQNRFYAAKAFLHSAAGRKRGFGQEASGQATLELKDKGGHRTITLKWIEPKEEPDGSPG